MPANKRSRAVSQQVDRPLPLSPPSSSSSSSSSSLRTTSRLVVKGLPLAFTSESLRTHFSHVTLSSSLRERFSSQALSCGLSIPTYLLDVHSRRLALRVTDARVMVTSEGASRRLGFVGFRSSAEALLARIYFHSTFIQTSRVAVEFAFERGSKEIGHVWSRHCKDKSKAPQEDECEEKRLHGDVDAIESGVLKLKKSKRLDTSNEDDALLTSDEKKQRKQQRSLASLLSSLLPAEKAQKLLHDPLFLDYLHAMGALGKAKFWSNDERAFSTQEKLSRSMKSSALNGSEQQDVQNALKSLNKAESEMDDDDDDTFQNPSVDLLSRNQLPKSNATALDSLISHSSTKHDTCDFHTPLDDEAGSKLTESNSDSAAALDVKDSCRLFVRNLPFELLDEEFEQLFASVGVIVEYHIPRNAVDQRCKGFAYVTLSSPREAEQARQSLDGKIVMGRILHVLISQARPVQRVEAETSTLSAFQAQREKERKARALKEHHVWNALFLRPDTVMSAMAAQLGIDKSDLLNIHDSSSLAVRMALAETRLVEETKAWLKQQNVQVEVLEERARELSLASSPLTSRMKRSDRVLLIKHTPFESDVNELRALFQSQGDLVKFAMPDTRCMALVEYGNAADAKKAFRKLAYTKYKHVPLYLEWAPEAALASSFPSFSCTTNNPIPSSTKAARQPNMQASVLKCGDIGNEATSNTIFVKNLNFSTTETQLLEWVAVHAKVRHVTVAVKKSSSLKTAQGQPKTLSMGYGFVELCELADVQRVIDALNQTVLDGHVIMLQPSTRSDSSSKEAGQEHVVEAQSSITSARLVVKNVPFEATAEELRTLFESRVSIKKLRMPKKIDGSHRGYAFLDLTNTATAQHAIETLGNTHLYGRKLIVQYATVKEEPREPSD